MIKKSVFEDEIIAGMERELVLSDKKEGIDNLGKAVDDLNSAIEIFDNVGMTTQADALLNILLKIAKKNKKCDPFIIGLTSEKMIENLKHHGTEFNLLNEGNLNDLLNADIEARESNEVSDADDDLPEMDFEDEL